MCKTRRRMFCKKMANPTRGTWKDMKKAGFFWKGVQKVTWTMQAGESRCELSRARGLGLGEGSRKKIDEQRHDGGALAENTGDESNTTLS